MRLSRPLSNPDPIEQEADVFALLLLMPKQLFLYWEKQGATIRELSKIFGVPRSAVLARMELLDVEEGL